MSIIEQKVFVSGNVAVIEVYNKWSKRYFYVLIDAEDLSKIKDKKLSINVDHRTNYCLITPGSKGLHRLIMDTPRGLVVDHINHNGLDNRKNNLRNCTLSENQQNRQYGVRNPLSFHNQHMLKAFRYPI